MDGSTAKTLGEQGIIELFAGSATVDDPRNGGPALIIPNGDDCAAWRFDGEDASVITTDSLVEGQHFDLAYTPPRAVGRKLMAVNLSDLAAMGAVPRYALISVCFGPETPAEVIRDMASGVHQRCLEYGVVVVGGNTTGTSGPSVLTAVLIGAGHPTGLIARGGAKAGDILYVTGHLGDAAAGLHLASKKRTQFDRASMDPTYAPLLAALTDPAPRVAEGLRLAETRQVRAMCDISDGFGRDLRRLLAHDGLGARVDVDRLPISDALRSYAATADIAPARFAMAGGEDYELLFTASSDAEDAIRRAFAQSEIQVHRVGVIQAEPTVHAVWPNGRTEPVPTGFEHF